MQAQFSHLLGLLSKRLAQSTGRSQPSLCKAFPSAHPRGSVLPISEDAFLHIPLPLHRKKLLVGGCSAIISSLASEASPSFSSCFLPLCFISSGVHAHILMAMLAKINYILPLTRSNFCPDLNWEVCKRCWVGTAVESSALSWGP